LIFRWATDKNFMMCWSCVVNQVTGCSIINIKVPNAVDVQDDDSDADSTQPDLPQVRKPAPTQSKPTPTGSKTAATPQKSSQTPATGSKVAKRANPIPSPAKTTTVAPKKSTPAQSTKRPTPATTRSRVSRVTNEDDDAQWDGEMHGKTPIPSGSRSNVDKGKGKATDPEPETPTDQARSGRSKKGLPLIGSPLAGSPSSPYATLPDLQQQQQQHTDLDPFTVPPPGESLQDQPQSTIPPPTHKSPVPLTFKSTILPPPEVLTTDKRPREDELAGLPQAKQRRVDPTAWLNSTDPTPAVSSSTQTITTPSGTIPVSAFLPPAAIPTQSQSVEVVSPIPQSHPSSTGLPSGSQPLPAPSDSTNQIPTGNPTLAGLLHPSRLYRFSGDHERTFKNETQEAFDTLNDSLNQHWDRGMSLQEDYIALARETGRVQFKVEDLQKRLDSSQSDVTRVESIASKWMERANGAEESLRAALKRVEEEKAETKKSTEDEISRLNQTITDLQSRLDNAENRQMYNVKLRVQAEESHNQEIKLARSAVQSALEEKEVIRVWWVFERYFVARLKKMLALVANHDVVLRLGFLIQSGMMQKAGVAENYRQIVTEARDPPPYLKKLVWDTTGMKGINSSKKRVDKLQYRLGSCPIQISHPEYEFDHPFNSDFFEGAGGAVIPASLLAGWESVKDALDVGVQGRRIAASRLARVSPHSQSVPLVLADDG
jgi:hypothetical protein